MIEITVHSGFYRAADEFWPAVERMFRAMGVTGCLTGIARMDGQVDYRSKGTYALTFSGSDVQSARLHLL